MAITPWLYYRFAQPLANALQLNPQQLLIIILLCSFMLELWRIKNNYLLFGQRPHENQQFSSAFWGVVGTAMVLLLAPEPQYSAPIIVAYALGDPLLGELRRRPIATAWVILLGVTLISGIWLASHIILATPWYFALLMGPLTVAVEWPCIKGLDDNLLMLVMPLLLTLLMTHPL